jgi:hypothetical protein
MFDALAFVPIRHGRKSSLDSVQGTPTGGVAAELGASPTRAPLASGKSRIHDGGAA